MRCSPRKSPTPSVHSPTVASCSTICCRWAIVAEAYKAPAGSTRSPALHRTRLFQNLDPRLPHPRQKPPDRAQFPSRQRLLGHCFFRFRTRIPGQVSRRGRPVPDLHRRAGAHRRGGNTGRLARNYERGPGNGRPCQCPAALRPHPHDPRCPLYHPR